MKRGDTKETTKETIGWKSMGKHRDNNRDLGRREKREIEEREDRWMSRDDGYLCVPRHQCT